MAATGSNGAKRRSGRGSAGRSEQRPASASRNGKKQSGKSADSADTKREIIGVVLILVGIILGIFCYAPRSSQGVIAAIVPLLFGIFGIGMYAVPVLCAALGVCVIAIRKDNSRTGHDRLRSRCRICAAFVHSPCRICKIDSRHELRKGCFPCMVRRQPPAQRRRFFRRKPCIPFCKAVRRHGRMCCTGGH